MSQLAYNFGLKLYNLQNVAEIEEMLDKEIKLDVPISMGLLSSSLPKKM